MENNQTQERVEKCITCDKIFVIDSEEYYWHIKIHNAKSEAGNLYEMFKIMLLLRKEFEVKSFISGLLANQKEEIIKWAKSNVKHRMGLSFIDHIRLEDLIKFLEELEVTPK